MMLLRISCHIGGSEKKETVDFDESTTDFETLLQDIADTLALLECHQSTISNVYELRTLKGGYAVRKTSQLKDEEELVFDQIVVDVEKAVARNEKQRRRQSRNEANDATIPVKLEPKENEEKEEEEEEKKEGVSEISDERGGPRRTRGTGTDNSLTLKREENKEEEDGDDEEVTYWRNQPENELKQEDDEPEESNIEPTTSQVNREELGQFKEDEEAQRQEAAVRPGSQEQTTSPQRTKRQTQEPTVTPERKRAKSRAEEGEVEAPNEEESNEKGGQHPQRMVDEVNRDGPLGTGPQHPARQTAARRPRGCRGGRRRGRRGRGGRGGRSNETRACNNCDIVGHLKAQCFKQGGGAYKGSNLHYNPSIV